MPKSVRIDFSNGINKRIDKAIAGTGFVSLMDNVDLRSGFPRPWKFPSYERDADSGTTRIWSYRGKWYESPKWRDYVGEFIDGKDRIYYTEEGSKPYAIIEGDSVPLGTKAPSLAPTVSTATSTSPIVSLVTTSGNYVSGRAVSYRVAWEFEGGIQPPSQKVLGTAISASTGFLLNWNSNQKAIKTLIFAGDSDQEKLLVELAGNVMSYTDTGATEATGTLASEYDDKAPYQYMYTFTKDVNGVQDESGPSDLSTEKTSNTGRSIVFDYKNDGTLTGALDTPAVSTIDVSPTAINVSSVASGTQYNQVKFELASDHGMKTGDKVILDGFEIQSNPSVTVSSVTEPKPFSVKFVTATAHGFQNGQSVLFDGFDDTAWNGLTFPVSYVSSTSFYVVGFENMPVGALGTVKSGEVDSETSIDGTYEIVIDSTDTDVFYIENINAPTGTLGTAQPVKTTLNFASDHGLVDNSTIYLVWNDGTNDKEGLYRVNLVDSNSIYISEFSSGTPAVTTSKYLANYLRYRNLYRTGAVQGYGLVEQLPMWQTSYTDTKSTAALGLPPESYYQENGQTVIFKEPPSGMSCIRSHYGMKFAIDGHKVRWTPIGQPNAWPEQFYFDFAYAPIAIEAFAQGMIVLCQDAVYRIDGNQPTGLSLTLTHGEDGCIAKNSVQKTHAGLVYLAKRGLMLFDGMNARCITDQRLPDNFLIAPSTLDVWGAYTWWWMIPTRFTYNYAALTHDDGIATADTGSMLLHHTVPIAGVNNAIKSFYWDGRYFMFWNDDNNYGAHTCITVDLQVQSMPITCVGMKIVDAHVDEFWDCHVLLADSANNSSDITNMNDYIGRQTIPSAIASFTSNAGKTIRKFNGSDIEMPYMIRTGQTALGGEYERKCFQHIEVHSIPSNAASTYARVYLDGRYTCETMLTPSEVPTKHRKMNIPKNKNVGYCSDLELTGTMRIRSVEYTFQARGES